MRLVASAALGVLMLEVSLANAQPPTSPDSPPPEVAPMPAQVHPSSACAASAALKQHETQTCPTCGHESACATCKPKKKGCWTRMVDFFTYRGIKPDKACKANSDSPHPPLYAWFPCAGGECDGDCDGGCGSCSKQRATAGSGIICRLHGVKNCSMCRGCPKGQCGAFWFVGRCKVNYPGKAPNCGCGTTDQPMPDATPVPAGEPLPAPTAAPIQQQVNAAVDPLVNPPIQQTVAYKKDPAKANVQTAAAPPKPASPKRVSTYRPEQMTGSMPVLSPDQFRRKPRP